MTAEATSEDLPQRLRRLADLDARAGSPLGSACHEAATEIERLRATLNRKEHVMDETCTACNQPAESLTVSDGERWCADCRAEAEVAQ